MVTNVGNVIHVEQLVVRKFKKIPIPMDYV